MAATCLLAYSAAERDEDGDFSDRAYVGGMLKAEEIEILRLLIGMFPKNK